MTLSTRIAVAVVFSLFSLAALAQQTAPSGSSSAPSSTPPQQPQANQQQSKPDQQPSQANQQQPLTSEQVLKQEEHQRALGVVPMFGMTSVKNAPPLSTKQKAELMARTMYDPFTFVAAGLTAGVGQATNSFAPYGQGAEGYGKRYGAALADGTDSNLWSNFIYPVIFKQDPRYFRVGEGPIKLRIYSAFKQEFVARKDSGGYTFHFSNVLGAFTAGTISNTYYPQSDRGVGLTVSRASIALGYGCLGDLFLEFWPDIQGKLFHKHESQARPSEPSGDAPK
ncbi:MAG: hypothetical protein ABSE85_13355 [Candidatus Korobacteraceae bacterium]|jgi:hypothetical protein